MNHITTKSTTWTIEWNKQGAPASETVNPGQIAGFESYFVDCADPLSSMLLGLTGTQRFETAAWLERQANKLGYEQYVKEYEIELSHTYIERINEMNATRQYCSELDLLKPTNSLKAKLMEAWSNVVMACEVFNNEVKIDLLNSAAQGNPNEFLTLSSILFSKSIETIAPEFPSLNAIFFPAVPINIQEWKGNPARLVAFHKELIVGAKPPAPKRVRVLH